MDDSLFPRTDCKKIVEEERKLLEKIILNTKEPWLERMKVFKRFQRWRLRRQQSKEGVLERMIFLPSFEAVSQLSEEVLPAKSKKKLITKLNNATKYKYTGGTKSYFGPRVMTEELADFRLLPPLKDSPIFQQNPDLFGKFVDLSIFTIRELGEFFFFFFLLSNMHISILWMMKEYGQLAFLEQKSVSSGEKSAVLTKGWDTRKRGYESGFDHENHPCFKHIQQRLNKRLHEQTNGIQVDQRAIEKWGGITNRERITDTTRPSVLWLKKKLDDGEADLNGHVQFENIYKDVDLYTNGSLLQTKAQLENKRGYVISKYAYDERQNKKIKELIEDMNSGKLGYLQWKMKGKDNREAHRLQKKRGKKFWHRSVAGAFRPRRFGMRRWGGEEKKKKKIQMRLFIVCLFLFNFPCAKCNKKGLLHK
ncbi:hypothetical protein RFI_21814 [Reticulomyxa filosa]|uniref:Uncharacterized protein n=1 Tax=Reticulomyxa filosa TaxID=46433 RepID=X6MNX2_RETFI|nr:hypothetical protein RFI_21814 [Reticulomyxa filosa]|eukprot:ETO15549.1 hypothetical protein RFI_21814 [Reticulomyxa filosa]